MKLTVKSELEIKFHKIRSIFEQFQKMNIYLYFVIKKKGRDDKVVLYLRKLAKYAQCCDYVSQNHQTMHDCCS